MALKDYISSDYVNAANRLQGKKARRRIVAYVESYDDILFWRMILSRFENESRYFEVMLPSRTSLNKGKKQALLSLMKHGAGNNMLACVDADYDYLIQGMTFQSDFMLNNKYVLISLYVDDKTPLPEQMTVKDTDGTERTLRTVGDKWSYLQRHKFGSNTQPMYILLDNEGMPLTGSRSYDEDINAYMDFLKAGLDTYNNK